MLFRSEYIVNVTIHSLDSYQILSSAERKYAAWARSAEDEEFAAEAENRFLAALEAAIPENTARIVSRQAEFSLISENGEYRLGNDEALANGLTGGLYEFIKDLDVLIFSHYGVWDDPSADNEKVQLSVIELEDMIGQFGDAGIYAGYDEEENAYCLIMKPEDFAKLTALARYHDGLYDLNEPAYLFGMRKETPAAIIKAFTAEGYLTEDEYRSGFGDR